MNSASVSSPEKENRLCLIVFSGEMDKLLAAFVLATGAAASGMSVSMFFTFWAIAALRKKRSSSKGKSFIESLFNWMMPAGLSKISLSKFNMCGIGKWLISREMKKKKIPDLPHFLALAAELGVEIQICEMSMSLLGIRQNELIEYPGIKITGAAYCLERCANARVSFFI